MKRIIIIGTTGAGKSTLGRKLAAKHGLAYTDLDDLHWLPGWQERPRDDFNAKLKEAVTPAGWVLAGNYMSRVPEIAWPLADTLIWLDIPFWPNFLALAKRTFTRARTQEDICNGNRESLMKQLFSKESLFVWFFKTWGKNRKRFGAIFAAPEAYPNLTLIRLCSYAEAAAFV